MKTNCFGPTERGWLIRPVFRRFCLLSTILFLTLGMSAETFGQDKNYSPDDPEVEAIVRKAVTALTAMGSGGRPGEHVLAALAIVQAGKRYDEEIPKDHPTVKSAVAMVLKMIPSQVTNSSKAEEGNLLLQNEVYFPSLSLLLLAEVDSVKYKSQIENLVQMLVQRQRINGSWSYLSEPQSGDTSQTQFAALALFVAKQRGIAFDPKVPAKALNWLVMGQQNGGNWVYKLAHGNKDIAGTPTKDTSATTPSIHTAGLGTTYLLADLLQLVERKKSLSVPETADGNPLPKTVTPYIAPTGGKEDLLNQAGPLVKFDNGKLLNAFRGGNGWLQNEYSIYPSRWGFYYLYALERYAWFREQAEGNMGQGSLKNWYNDGVAFLRQNQTKSGAFGDSKFENENGIISTAFGILFLVRSSEVLQLPPGDSTLLGGKGFPTDTVLSSSGGKIQGSIAEKNLSEMLALMKDDEVSQQQLANLTRSLKKSISQFKKQEDKSRGQVKSFLLSMVKAEDYHRRLIAVRFLAGEQDLDNVPALIYALGDPDFRICLEAHDGLRLISRRIDSLPISEQTRKNSENPNALTPENNTVMRLEYTSLKKSWSTWFQTIRPDAELLD